VKALTLWRPWPWAIFHAPSDLKRVENRSWKPPSWIIGERIAIHAGRRFQREAVEFVADIAGECPTSADDHPTGVIGVARVMGWVRPLELLASPDPSAPAWVQAAQRSDWLVGDYGWVLGGVVALPEPIECKGAQGLWNVPADIALAIEAQAPPHRW